jgi:hypothetical protein
VPTFINNHYHNDSTTGIMDADPHADLSALSDMSQDVLSEMNWKSLKCVSVSNNTTDRVWPCRRECASASRQLNSALSSLEFWYFGGLN